MDSAQTLESPDIDQNSPEIQRTQLSASMRVRAYAQTTELVVEKEVVEFPSATRDAFVRQRAFPPKKVTVR
jgi:hypothetical protein